MKVRIVILAEVDEESLARHNADSATRHVAETPPADPREWDVYQVFRAFNRGYLILGTPGLDGKVEVLP